MNRESIKLDIDRKKILEDVAMKCGVTNKRGTKSGKPSWRSLVYAIADLKVECKRAK